MHVSERNKALKAIGLDPLKSDFNEQIIQYKPNFSEKEQENETKSEIDVGKENQSNTDI